MAVRREGRGGAPMRICNCSPETRGALSGPHAWRSSASSNEAHVMFQKSQKMLERIQHMESTNQELSDRRPRRRGRCRRRRLNRLHHHALAPAVFFCRLTLLPMARAVVSGGARNRGASQPATDASPTPGASQPPSGAPHLEPAQELRQALDGKWYTMEDLRKYYQKPHTAFSFWW